MSINVIYNFHYYLKTKNLPCKIAREAFINNESGLLALIQI